MKYIPGFINQDFEFVPAHKASPVLMERGLFHSWYEFSGRVQSLDQELAQAIEQILPGSVVFSSGSTWNRALVQLIVSLRRDVEILKVTNTDLSPDFLAWVENNKYRFFFELGSPSYGFTQGSSGS